MTLSSKKNQSTRDASWSASRRRTPWVTCSQPHMPEGAQAGPGPNCGNAERLHRHCPASGLSEKSGSSSIFFHVPLGSFWDFLFTPGG